jgi:hypothetical protein
VAFDPGLPTWKWKAYRFGAPTVNMQFASSALQPSQRWGYPAGGLASFSSCLPSLSTDFFLFSEVKLAGLSSAAMIDPTTFAWKDA